MMTIALFASSVLMIHGAYFIAPTKGEVWTGQDYFIFVFMLYIGCALGTITLSRIAMDAIALSVEFGVFVI